MGTREGRAVSGSSCEYCRSGIDSHLRHRVSLREGGEYLFSSLDFVGTTGTCLCRCCDPTAAPLRDIPP
jgi:hypothetical protein